MSSDQPDDLWEAADSLSTQLGLPEKFLHRLREADDDWSFVIKCHALLESGLSYLLASVVFGKPEVQSTLSQVDTSHKIKMCSDLEQFEAEDRKIMRWLSNLRNELVHNAHKVTFTFEENLKNKDRADVFAETFRSVWNDPVTIKGVPVSRKQFTLENAKLTVWSWLVLVLGEIELSRRKSEYEKHKTAANATLLNTYEELFEKMTKVVSATRHSPSPSTGTADPPKGPEN